MSNTPIRQASRPAAVLFDLDGTLIDSAPDLVAAINAMRLARGHAMLPLDQCRPLAGAGARGLIGLAFDIGPEHPDFPPLRDEFFDRYEAILTQNTRVFEGVADLLATLTQARLPWGIVTNKSQRFALPLVRAIPELRGAAVLVCGDTTPHAKPHPAPLIEAARRLGAPSPACVYVGDDERDVTASRAAGMRTIVAGYGYGAAADASSAWPADACINSPRELLKWLGMP